MLTFTGERVIPGAVEPDLWNEHVSRYYFAREFAVDRRVLDLGCGAGYGTNLIAGPARWAMGIDLSPETIEHAVEHAEHGASFCVASAEAVPVPGQSFDLITAFEVIEHLSGWPALISEAARILAPGGMFLVSTPNKAYYAETRENVGPNPFHVHEFEMAEFREALAESFAEVLIFAQNHQETIAFADETGSGVLSGYLSDPPALANAHFFLAICSQKPLDVPAFMYAASSGNLLRERETYIRLLKQEVNSLTGQSDWQVKELDSTRAELNSTRMELDLARVELNSTRMELNSARTELNSTRVELNSTRMELDSARTELNSTRMELDVIRTKLANATEQLDRLQAERKLAAQSKWLRFGRSLGLGPQL